LDSLGIKVSYSCSFDMVRVVSDEWLWSVAKIE
jgi:hypothetical protein